MISIIVPIYNLSSYIDKCLQSILQQTYTEYEIILVNDGSTDDSYNKCIAFKAKNPLLDITIINKQNEGVTAARRDGVRKSKGEWITFVDGDDTLPTNALENLIMYAKPDINIVLGAYHFEYDNNTYKYSFNKAIGKFNSVEYIKILLAEKVEIAPWAKLFRKELFNEYIFDLPKEITNKEDLIMNIRIAITQTNNVMIIAESVYNYRYNREGSAFTQYYKKLDIDYEIKILDYLSLSFIDNNTFGYNKGIANKYLSSIWGWRKNMSNLTKQQIKYLKSKFNFILCNTTNIKNFAKIMILYSLLFVGMSKFIKIHK